MTTKLLLILVLALTSLSCTRETTHRSSRVDTLRVDDAKAPFILAIVPSTSWPDSRGITIAEKQPREFYVVLTNVSTEAQSVWEDSNSWGYGTLSFEFTMADGQKIVVSKRQQVVFTVNRPSTFLIPPGEHQVYPIRLDKSWDTGPKLSKLAETTTTVKAIYEVSTTSESKQYKVWAGRVESGSYMFTLRHW